MEVILSAEMEWQVIRASQHNEEQQAGLVVVQMDEVLRQIVLHEEHQQLVLHIIFKK
jgi:hypothetical protein